MSTVHKLTPKIALVLPYSVFIPSSGWNWVEVCALGAADWLKLGYTHWSKSRNPPTP